MSSTKIPLANIIICFFVWFLEQSLRRLDAKRSLVQAMQRSRFQMTLAQTVVAWRGPASVCINSHGTQFYTHGVYDGVDKSDLSICKADEVDHAMLAVGYGTSASGMDYWILKNSWGADWGNDGYLYLVRNKQNRCGITTLASYPIV